MIIPADGQVLSKFLLEFGKDFNLHMLNHQLYSSLTIRL